MMKFMKIPGKFLNILENINNPSSRGTLGDVAIQFYPSLRAGRVAGLSWLSPVMTVNLYSGLS